MCVAVPLAQAGRHRRKVTYDSKPPVPTPRPQRSTCERLAYVLPEGRMLESPSLGLSCTNFPSFCLGLWYGSVCTSGDGMVWVGTPGVACGSLYPLLSTAGVAPLPSAIKPSVLRQIALQARLRPRPHCCPPILHSESLSARCAHPCATKIPIARQEPIAPKKPKR